MRGDLFNTIDCVRTINGCAKCKIPICKKDLLYWKRYLEDDFF